MASNLLEESVVDRNWEERERYMILSINGKALAMIESDRSLRRLGKIKFFLEELVRCLKIFTHFQGWVKVEGECGNRSGQ